MEGFEGIALLYWIWLEGRSFLNSEHYLLSLTRLYQILSDSYWAMESKIILDKVISDIFR